MRDGMLAVAKKPPSKYELFEVSIQNTVSLQREFVTRQQVYELNFLCIISPYVDTLDTIFINTIL